VYEASEEENKNLSKRGSYDMLAWGQVKCLCFLLWRIFMAMIVNAVARLALIATAEIMIIVVAVLI
jgi:hypothetical protein